MNIPERYTKEDATEEDKQVYEQYKGILSNFKTATEGLYMVMQPLYAPLIEHKENDIE